MAKIKHKTKTTTMSKLRQWYQLNVVLFYQYLNLFFLIIYLEDIFEFKVLFQI